MQGNLEETRESCGKEDGISAERVGQDSCRRVPSGRSSGEIWGVNQHAAIQAAPALAEPLEAVDGGRAGFGVAKGEQLPVHGAPGARESAPSGFRVAPPPGKGSWFQ